MKSSSVDRLSHKHTIECHTKQHKVQLLHNVSDLQYGIPHKVDQACKYPMTSIIAYNHPDEQVDFPSIVHRSVRPSVYLAYVIQTAVSIIPTSLLCLFPAY